MTRQPRLAVWGMSLVVLSGALSFLFVLRPEVFVASVRYAGQAPAAITQLASQTEPMTVFWTGVALASWLGFLGGWLASRILWRSLERKEKTPIEPDAHHRKDYHP
jgi:hypothetical protein